MKLSLASTIILKTDLFGGKKSVAFDVEAVSLDPNSALIFFRFMLCGMMAKNLVVSVVDLACIFIY